MRPAARLRRTSEVQRARREGASRSDRMYVVSLVAGNASASRLAVSAPARLGTAVRRNRARRRTRAAFAPLLLRLRPPCDVVVTVRAAALDAPFGGLSGSAESLLRELGRLDARP